MGHRPSTAIGARMLPTLSGPSFFSRDMHRVMHGMDEMFDTMLGDMGTLFYEPLPLQRMGRPYYLLQDTPRRLNALAQSKAKDDGLIKNSFGITQDDKQLQIVVGVPGASASDINLELEGDGRVLKISGETKRENEGISVHSRFERSFTLPRDVDANGIAASIDNGVLTITAPKYEEEQTSVRRIDVVEHKKAESKDEVASPSAIEGVDTSAQTHKKVESENTKPEVDDNVIDLDVEKE